MEESLEKKQKHQQAANQFVLSNTFGIKNPNFPQNDLSCIKSRRLLGS